MSTVDEFDKDFEDAGPARRHVARERARPMCGEPFENARAGERM